MSGIYIHIPFCHSKCSYCDFFSTPDSKYMQRYIDAVIKEWELRKHELTGALNTIYIGGGTPSILPLDLLERLVTALPRQNILEFTIEANPEDVTREWIEGIKSMGINRVSMGVQSFNDDELKAVNRRHSSMQAHRAIELLTAAGITDVSVDVIYGLPLQSLSSWRSSLDALLQYRLPHLSAYALSYEPGTRLYAQLIAGKIKEASDSQYAAMYDTLIELTERNGYEHYEISNFALPGHKAIHNSHYWDFTPYLGLGCSSHSFDGSCRRFNPSNIKKYEESLESGKVCYEQEDENPDELYNDYIITRLRTSDGIAFNDFVKRFGADDLDAMLRTAAPHLASGNLEKSDSGIKLARRAVLISDSILRELIR